MNRATLRARLAKLEREVSDVDNMTADECVAELRTIRAADPAGFDACMAGEGLSAFDIERMLA